MATMDSSAPHTDSRHRQAILWAWLAAGTLDIADAALWSIYKGGSPMDMLRYVASGPFGDGAQQGGTGMALAGLGVHFAIMLVMVTTYVLAAARQPLLITRPWLFGPLYGLALYGVMFLIVRPLRFGTWPNLAADSLTNQLVAHIVFVGLSIGLITAHFLRKPAD
ncbi:hypothetical protein M9M90_08585 [Phenylobacterium sp. LH3H17]|uniref:hypothetical protein n=1 Tax=Phenylobacterium sp. LH3H17 TaxID=2903901 RepID=UPI0020C98C69|nr:hypothetical protein [Phenylobacterium sp. LH3H17]UTP41218.1 hypothetical protein M9M90_08585 [Phenylobacterium sp. LH3H17]